MDNTTDTIREIDKLQFLLYILKDIYYKPNEVNNPLNLKETIKKIGQYPCIIEIEYPYSEKDYLSNYYRYYSGKYLNYSKYNIRIHFYKNETHLGFISLRPGIPGQNIGKSYLSPKLLLEDNYQVLTKDFKFHYYGYEDYVNCYPWMKQETDISVCSHVCLWSTIRYFSRFTDYSDTTMGEIVERVKDSQGRKIPSTGLEVKQVINVLETYGLNSLILGKIDAFDRSSFRASLFGYLESGIPIIAFDSNKKHTVSIIGHSKENVKLIDERFQQLQKSNNEPQHYILHSDLIEEIIYSDDNKSPYEKKKCSINDNISRNTIKSYSSFIVPLYKKMEYTFIAVYNKFESMYNTYLENKLSYTFTFPDKFILRIYLSTSNSLKQHMARECGNLGLNDIIIRLNLPRFVWNIDISSIDDFTNGKTTCKLLIDSTAFIHAENPWLLVHDSFNVHYYDNETNKSIYTRLAKPIEPYKLFNNMHSV